MTFRLDTSVITFPSGRTIELPFPLPLKRLAEEKEMQSSESPLVAIRIDGLLYPLNEGLPFRTAKVEPVFLHMSQGHSCLKRSLVFLLQMATAREYEEKLLITVEHSFGSGFMCLIEHGQTKATEEHVSKLTNRMNELIKQDLPLNIEKLAHIEARQYFSKRRRPYSHSFISSASEFAVRVSMCDNHFEIFRRPLVPSTGILANKFELKIYDVGLVLRFPEVTNINLLPEFVPDPDITAVYKECHRWGTILRAGSVGDLNQKVLDGESKSYIALNEAVHNQKIVQVSDDIANRVEKETKLILIAGPSASGKTTFASKLAIQLEILGITPTILSVDNYYKPHSQCPRDESGKLDFEVLEALRIDTLNEHLLELFEGKEIKTPMFDFFTGKPKEETKTMQIAPGGVVIMEGIHCLNDKLTPRIPSKKKYKIFLAPFSQMNLDESNYIANNIGRLIRRIVRDYNHRGYSAMDTLNRWNSVRRGEELHIFPFMKCADTIFNTALDYEVSVLKTFCKPLLKSLKPGDYNFNMAQELLGFLACFFAVPHDHVPPDSLLREFIGGSFFNV